jgi:peptidoglycan/xylan/chitin deacetylase (PgdA/CDA1 family)
MILMYHHIAPADAIPPASRRQDEEGWNFTHSPEGFERQLRELMRRGWRFLSLDEMVAVIQTTGKEPPKAAAITFDDGWIDNFIHALPVLRRLRLTATFFLTTQHLTENQRDPRRMQVEEIRHLVDEGMSVGGHTRSHPDLRGISPEDARREILGCKVDLEQLFQKPVRFFAYPGGAFDQQAVEWVRRFGYEAACSVYGPAPNTRDSLYWLFRDVLTESMSTLRDRYRLCSLARRGLAFRVHRQVRQALAADA